jgi:hypothetical protein
VAGEDRTPTSGVTTHLRHQSHQPPQVPSPRLERESSESKAEMLPLHHKGSVPWPGLEPGVNRVRTGRVAITPPRIKRCPETRAAQRCCQLPIRSNTRPSVRGSCPPSRGRLVAAMPASPCMWSTVTGSNCRDTLIEHASWPLDERWKTVPPSGIGPNSPRLQLGAITRSASGAC